MKAISIMVAALLLMWPGVGTAEVVKVEMAAPVTVAGGQSFGLVGAYEKLGGTMEFALDPNNPHNKAIADLQYAPRAADGKVHFTSDVHVLRPVGPSKGNGVLFFEIANRGNKLIFWVFQ